jgi:hypothetical protein
MTVHYSPCEKRVASTSHWEAFVRPILKTTKVFCAPRKSPFGLCNLSQPAVNGQCERPTFLLIGRSSIRITVRRPDPDSQSSHLAPAVLHSCIVWVNHWSSYYQCSCNRLAGHQDVQHVERYRGPIYYSVKRLASCEATPHIRKYSWKTHVEGYTSVRCMQGKHIPPLCTTL